MTFLLDVNVLIALIDPAHIQHDRAHEWFAAGGRQAWATCPLTENGVLRILSNARYPNSPGVPAVIAPVIQGLRSLAGHAFWPDDISLLDPQKLDTTRLMTTGQVTDSYLLALAVAHGGQLATFDRRLIADAVRNGAQSLHLID
jgi:toxin-antitoxin system PIN domain toxin